MTNAASYTAPEADQPTVLEECCHHSARSSLSWQRIAGKEHLRHVLCVVRQALNTLTIQFIIAMLSSRLAFTTRHHQCAI